jgi:hypothetical protein
MQFQESLPASGFLRGFPQTTCPPECLGQNRLPEFQKGHDAFRFTRKRFRCSTALPSQSQHILFLLLAIRDPQLHLRCGFLTKGLSAVPEPPLPGLGIKGTP